MTALKYCPVCAQDLPLDAFWRDSHSATGRTSICKDCRKALYQGKAKRPPTADDVEYTCADCGVTCLRPRRLPNVTRCPVCQDAANRASNATAGKRRLAETRANKRGDVFVACTERCGHFDYCEMVVKSGAALPCAPGSAIKPVDYARPLEHSNWRVTMEVEA